MEARAAGIRDVSLLGFAVVLGVLVSPALPFIGLPIVAAGLASLAYRGSAVAAAVAAALGVIAVTVVSPPDVLYAAPAVVAVLLTIALLPRWNTQAVGALLTGVLTVAGIAAAEVFALSQHTTLTASIAQSARQVSDALSASLGSSATASTLAWLHKAEALLTAAWPWTYFESAVYVSIIVIAVVAWAARRAGRQLDVPPLGMLDLTPHVLWAFVAGLLLLAASYSHVAGSATLWAVGLNLVLCARTLFFVQGFGVSAGLLDRTGVGPGARIFALAALAVLDAFTLVLSFVGLLDFWVNFRRLPREGSTSAPSAPLGG